MIAAVLSLRGHGEGVGPRTGFGERVGGNGIGGEARQVALLLFGIRPAHDGVVDDGVLHIDDHAG